MSSEIKFPFGYHLTLVDKYDIIEELSSEIDKDVMLDIVNELEDFNEQTLEQGHDIRFPFLGDIITNKGVLTKSEKDEIETISNDASEKRFLARQLVLDKKINNTERYKYEKICRSSLKRFPSLFKLFKKKYSIEEALVIISSLFTMHVVCDIADFSEREI